MALTELGNSTSVISWHRLHVCQLLQVERVPAVTGVTCVSCHSWHVYQLSQVALVLAAIGGRYVSCYRWHVCQLSQVARVSAVKWHVCQLPQVARVSAAKWHVCRLPSGTYVSCHVAMHAGALLLRNHTKYIPEFINDILMQKNCAYRLGLTLSVNFSIIIQSQDLNRLPTACHKDTHQEPILNFTWSACRIRARILRKQQIFEFNLVNTL